MKIYTKQIAEEVSDEVNKRLPKSMNVRVIPDDIKNIIKSMSFTMVYHTLKAKTWRILFKHYKLKIRKGYGNYKDNKINPS